jgi:hypothetical protein
MKRDRKKRSKMHTSTSIMQKSIVDLPDAVSIFRELLEVWGYNRYTLTDADKRKIGADLARFIGRTKPYSREYITNILAGRHVGETVRVAILNLLAVADGAKIEQVKSQTVSVQAMGEVHPGSLILSNSRQCVCGLWFVPRVPNQKYHTSSCRRKVIKSSC